MLRTTTLLLLALLVGFAAARPQPGGAQNILPDNKIVPPLAGGAAGLAAGGYVAIGIVTLQARRGRYLYSSQDALGWHATPILVGPSVGFLIGLFDPARLERTIVGGAAGGLLGTGIGWLIGLQAWAPPEGKWAGGVIGGASGILVGSLAGLLWPWPAEEEAEGQPAAAALRLPIDIRIRF